MNYKTNIFWGITSVLVLSAIITAGVIYRNRAQDRENPSSAAPDGKVHHTSADDIEDEPIIIRHNGEAYSMDGNKIIPTN